MHLGKFEKRQSDKLITFSMKVTFMPMVSPEIIPGHYVAVILSTKDYNCSKFRADNYIENRQNRLKYCVKAP